MNRCHVTGFTVCLLCVFAAGCASVTGPAERSAQADKISVYETSPPGSRPYRLVKRIWVESWKSAFTVPRYGSDAEGAADLQNQAVALGGDAIMYFGCYRLDAGAPRESGAGLICNGNVIKYVQ
jgi:hypothetical protein